MIRLEDIPIKKAEELGLKLNHEFRNCLTKYDVINKATELIERHKYPTIIVVAYTQLLFQDAEVKFKYD